DSAHRTSRQRQHSHCARSVTLTLYLFFLLTPPPPTPTLFPYTTLFRSLANLLEQLVRPDHRTRTFGTCRLVEGGGRSGPLVLKPDRKSTRLNSSHDQISYAVFCLKKKRDHLRRRARGHRGGRSARPVGG